MVVQYVIMDHVVRKRVPKIRASGLSFQVQSNYKAFLSEKWNTSEQKSRQTGNQKEELIHRQSTQERRV